MTESEARELYRAVCLELEAKLGLPCRWPLLFDGSVQRFGACHFRRDPATRAVVVRHISLSRKLVALNSEKEVGATIRHEIAHALVDYRHKHDATWRAMAIRCGDDGRRCYRSEDVARPPSLWVAICPGCGEVKGRQRAPKPGRKQSCGTCSSRFDERFLLTFKMAVSADRVQSTDPNIREVLRLRATGMGYVAIDAKFGIFGKKGWWSWKIVKENS